MSQPFVTFTWVEIIIFIILAIPTAAALINGAPFVPSNMKQVKRMFSAVQLKPGMRFYDLGCGDGRFVHYAAKNFKANATGYEYSPLVWLLAQSLRPFWRSGAEIKYGNFWKKDLSDADVIVCYLLPKAMARVEERILPTLKKGTLIVSHAFSFPNRKPIKTLPRDRKQKLGPIHVYKI
jgi:SAM-dependent methyltransferase